MTGRRNRAALVVVIAAMALIAGGVALAVQAGPSPQTASPLVVQGRVTGTDGQPVPGIKVWLNAWPAPAVVRELAGHRQPVWVTVVGSATTSAAGIYALPVVPSAALTADATNGVIRFIVMTGDGAGSDTFSFSSRLVPPTRTTSPVLSGGTRSADLRLMPYRTSKVPGA
jgi:hypothetical protein